uniref:Uncharacterized protein n=1 Tax=Glossina austeni TaxID=7395 RepID=A0A1A9VP25_GLOAU
MVSEKDSNSIIFPMTAGIQTRSIKGTRGTPASYELSLSGRKMSALYKACGHNDSTGNAKLDMQTIKFNDHNCPVWRVCWNILASTLISTGDDGCARVWRMNYIRNWKCAAVLRAESSSGVSQEPPVSSPTFSASAAATAKYYKKGIISNPNQVPWH